MVFFRILIFVLGILITGNATAQAVVSHLLVETNTLSKSTIRSIFLMRKTEWESGDPIVVFVLESSNPVHEDFCKNILGLFPYQLQQVWDRLIFSGTGQAPRYVESIKKMKEMVSATPGAIGYVGEDDVDDSVRQINVE